MNREQLIADIRDLAIEDIDGALIIVTGLFVSLHEAYVRLNGDDGDDKKQIDIELPEVQRKITIHPIE